MRRSKGVNEWNDPYQIVDSDSNSSESESNESGLGVSEERRHSIIQAVIIGYEEQHTTTPLDEKVSYKLKELTPIDDDPVTEYEFVVQRFVHRTPAGRHTGCVQLNDGEWKATYEKQPWGRGIVNAVRDLFPNASTD